MNPHLATLLDEHLDVLIQRRDWLSYEIAEAAEQDWNQERDRKERDALSWVIMLLKATKMKDRLTA